jgi:hypothetical protein
MSLATVSDAPIERGVYMEKVLINWDRNPVSIHHSSKDVIDACLLHLRNQHMVSKRSISMPDRERGGYLAFIYQVFDPQWVISWDERRLSGEE